LPRSYSHNGPTNPRNKPQTIPNESETQEAKDLAALRMPRRTVRNDLADNPRWTGGRSSRPRRTVRNYYPNNKYGTLKYGRSVATPRTVRPARTVRQRRADNPANLFQSKTPNSTDQNKATQELAKNTTNSRLLGSSRTVRRPRADGLPGAETTART
jgi:hypothetical protein